MSYTVLARKFRSQTFGEVVGQDPITTTLRNAIVSDRIHHGYLFCGTRGVGKTSMARILAKCLNCLSSDKPTPDPCCTCDSCESIARGEDVDVIEIDAASNTGVDNIRDLRSNAIYRPARARFKVYIIDEVHMLSTAAFNALLKTLEEPPDHVKFIFATTEAQKVPATIQSRVQRFDFKSISVPEIATQLESICKKEEVSADAAAIRRIARLANGSMRDALSLLDQVLSLSETISPEVVDEILPVPHDEVLSRLIDRVGEGDAAGALAVVDESLGQGYTLDYWCTLLIDQMRDLMVLRVCGAETELVDAPAGLRPVLLEQSGKFDAGAYVYMISLLEELRRSVKFSGSGRALVDSAVVRLAEASNFSSIETLLECVEGVDSDSRPPAGAVNRPSPKAQEGVAAVPPCKAESPVPGSSESGPGSREASASSVGHSTGPRPTTSGSGGRVTQSDLKTAHAEPMVRAALDVFDGRIIEVQQGPGTPTAEPPGP